jgi:hypothetical protein
MKRTTSSEIFTVDQVTELISQGKRLLLAGDESLLAELPAGQWIGGTTPYFMTRHGGLCTLKHIFATELPACATDIEIKTYDEENISQVFNDAPLNGFSFIIIPAMCKIHYTFALNAPDFENFAVRPLIGWISGVLFEDFGKESPKVFNGLEPVAITDGAIVMHVTLAQETAAEIGIINIFKQGSGDTITFPESGFETLTACINGEEMNFNEYLQAKNIDKKRPLVANHAGVMLNTSIQEKCGENGEVKFYAPVFSSVAYKLAKPVENYMEKFIQQTSSALGGKIIFTCNCVLNFIYSNMERTNIFYTSGLSAYGEIAYQVLNQTMVYLRIINRPKSTIQ